MSASPPDLSGGRVEPFPLVPPAGFERRRFRAGGFRLAIDRPPIDGTVAAVAADGDTASSVGAHGGGGADDGRTIEEDAKAILRFHDAVLLDEHGVLLDGLADWLGEEGDWRPDEGGEDSFDATLRTEGDGRCIGIGFDDEARLHALGDLPPPWRGSLSLLRHRLAVELVLDRFALGSEDLARWAGGSVVLLPNSFRSSWQAVLSAPPEPMAEYGAPSTLATTVPAHEGGQVDGEAHSISRTPAVAAYARVVLEELFHVESARLGIDPLETLSPAAADVLGSLDGRRGRVRLSTDADGGVSSTAGTLARFGDGLAFVIDAPAGAVAATDVAANTA